MKNFIRGAGLLLLAMGSSAVMAVPITGVIAFSGTATDDGSSLTFNNVIVGIAGATGTFAAEGVAFPDPVAFTDFNYTPGSFAPVTPLWAVGGFTFDLATVTIEAQTPGFLSLSGTGTLMNAGYDDTAYEWTYSSNPLGNTSFEFFSAASSPTPVPEPGSLALLGLGLVGFAVTGYKRRRTQA